jgi:hypothetical protein
MKYTIHSVGTTQNVLCISFGSHSEIHNTFCGDNVEIQYAML